MEDLPWAEARLAATLGVSVEEYRALPAREVYERLLALGERGVMKMRYQVDDCRTWRRCAGTDDLSQAYDYADEYGEFVIWEREDGTASIIDACIKAGKPWPSCPGGLPEACDKK